MGRKRREVLLATALLAGVVYPSAARADGNRTVVTQPGTVVSEGGTVQVSVSGYTAGAHLSMVLCDNNATSVTTDCNWAHASTLPLPHRSTSGTGSFATYVTDGTNTYCDLFNPCRLYVLESRQSLATRAAYGLLAVSPTCSGCATPRQASATPNTNVSDGQQLNVSWSGFAIGAQVTLIECSASPTSVAASCDPATASPPLSSGAAGSGSSPFSFRTSSETLFDCVNSSCEVFVLESPGDLSDASASVAISTSPSSPPPSSRGRPFPSTGRTLQRFTAAQMTSGPMSQTQAVAIAQANDVVSAQVAMFSPYVAAMKAANPNLVLLVYFNGTMAQANQGSAYPASWYLRDASGNQVTTAAGNYAMDPTNPGWIQDRISTCQTRLASSGYDGCFVDVLGPGPSQPGYLSAPAINPHTGQPWTTADWMAATSALQASIVNAVSPTPVVGNGLYSGAAFANPVAPTSQLLASGAGDVAESWMRTQGSSAGSFPTEAQWLQDVNLLTSTSATGSHAFVITKVWTGATQAQVDAWHLFSLATFLMGADGSQYYEFSGTNSFAGVLSDSAWDHAPIGNPTGPYAVSNSLYQRTFSNGLVTVNLGPAQVTVNLSGSYVDLNGNPVTTLTLAQYGASVLIKA
jgi:hypothetical protein